MINCQKRESFLVSKKKVNKIKENKFKLCVFSWESYDSYQMSKSGSYLVLIFE